MIKALITMFKVWNSMRIKIWFCQKFLSSYSKTKENLQPELQLMYLNSSSKCQITWCGSSFITWQIMVRIESTRSGSGWLSRPNNWVNTKTPLELGSSMKMDENLSKNALFKVQYLKSDFIFTSPTKVFVPSPLTKCIIPIIYIYIKYRILTPL